MRASGRRQHDLGVPARDARVVEAQVGLGAAAEDRVAAGRARAVDGPTSRAADTWAGAGVGVPAAVAGRRRRSPCCSTRNMPVSRSSTSSNRDDRRGRRTGSPAPRRARAPSRRARRRAARRTGQALVVVLAELDEKSLGTIVRPRVTIAARSSHSRWRAAAISTGCDLGLEGAREGAATSRSRRRSNRSMTPIAHLLEDPIGGPGRARPRGRDRLRDWCRWYLRGRSWPRGRRAAAW